MQHQGEARGGVEAPALDGDAVGEFRAEGQDPVRVIENAIANGWQGLYEIRDGGGQGAQRGARNSRHFGFDNMDYSEGLDENGQINL